MSYGLPSRLRHSLLNALRVAATQFDADAAATGEEVVRVARKSMPRATNVARIHDQFVQQAREARELYVLFTDAWDVKMEVPTCDNQYTLDAEDAPF